MCTLQPKIVKPTMRVFSVERPYEGIGFRAYERDALDKTGRSSSNSAAAGSLLP